MQRAMKIVVTRRSKFFSCLCVYVFFLCWTLINKIIILLLLSYVWSKYEAFKMKYRSRYICFRWGGSAPHPSGWSSASDPVFPQWHQVPIGLTNQYTKLNTNRAIALVNITILVWTNTFLLFLLSPKIKLKLWKKV